MTITYAELDDPMESKDTRIEELEAENAELNRIADAAHLIGINHIDPKEPGRPHTNSPHINTMTFDMTDKDGIDAFEYARLGKASHEVLWALWDEMCKHQDDYCGPDQITQQWIQRLNELMDYHYVPLEIK